ncbi:hypothetical protein ACFL2V_18625 [Pseudomonadota bacterium]
MITKKQQTSLINAATLALDNPYPKNSKTAYAAAVLTNDNNIYSSAQYFSDTYSLTLHAEQGALAHAAAHGESDIIAIAITSNETSPNLCYPCHMCKQLLWESRLRSSLSMSLIIFNQQGKKEILDLDEVINYPWPAQ